MDRCVDQTAVVRDLLLPGVWIIAKKYNPRNLEVDLTTTLNDGLRLSAFDRSTKESKVIAISQAEIADGSYKVGFFNRACELLA